MKFATHIRPSINEGALIHIESGLPFAPHFPEIEVENIEQAIEAQEAYVAMIMAFVESGKYRINPRVVDPSYRALYEDVSPAIQLDNASPSTKEESKPVSNEAVEAVLKVHQMTLDKGAKTAGQVAKAIYSCAVIKYKHGERWVHGLVLRDKRGDEIAKVYDNRKDASDGIWKNPYKKFPDDLGEAMWNAEDKTIFYFSRPAYVATRDKYLMSVLQFDGEYSTSQF